MSSENGCVILYPNDRELENHPAALGDMTFLEFCSIIRAVECYVTQIADNDIHEVKRFCELHTKLSHMLRLWPGPLADNLKEVGDAP